MSQYTVARFAIPMTRYGHLVARGTDMQEQEKEPAIEERWWELPVQAYRPQYLELMYRLREKQPSGSLRTVELAVAMLDI